MATGLILDGIFGSQAIDSSGEILDIEGADISDLEEGRGVLNWEHKSAEEAGNNGQEIVGKIIFAKKILKESDCDNARQREYWKKVKLPFIYGICRLYDGAGHEGAKAIAAQIRDHHANGEPILVRFSVEGSTLEKEGNVLKRSCIRRVAATLKPCNRTAISGLLEDPNAPTGFDKKPVQKVGDVLADLAEDAKKMEHEHPGYQKLGGATDVEYLEFSEADQQGLTQLVEKARAIRKALTAGGGDVAPSQLSGGAALVREDLVRFKDKAMQTLKSFLDKNQDFERSQVVQTFKNELPEASDEFIEHFADIAEDYRLKLRKQDGEDPYPKLNPAAHPEQTRVNRAKEKPGAMPARVKAGLEMKAGGTLLLPPPGQKRVAGQPPPKPLRLRQHFPKDDIYKSILDPDWGLENGVIDEQQHAIINKTVHEPWHRAMANWMPLNNALKEGKVPKSIIAKSVIFAAMSPNTSVPNQEMYYGHYMDMLHEGKVDPTQPISEEAIREFTARSTIGVLPLWNRDLFATLKPEEYGQHGNKKKKNGRDKGELPQIRGLRSAHLLFPRLEHLTAKYRDDAQGISAELMDLKDLHETKLKRTHPDVDGYGPKLTRYLLGMYGGGNMIVPDRHMIRSLFDLELQPDPETNGRFIGSPELDKLQEQVFTNPKNERLLRSVDHNFFTRHPAVRHVLETFPKHFQGRERQAIFPAFWLHWLAIGHYDKLRGRAFMGFNAGADHRVFFDSVRDEMIKHGLHPHPIHDGRVSEPGGDLDDSFDFGDNVRKSEIDPWPRHPDHHGHPAWLKAAGAVEALRQRWGENPALFAFFSHILPKVMRAESQPVAPVAHAPNPVYHPHLVKMEGLLIDLRKNIAEAAAGGDQALAEVAPHIHQVYALRPGPDLKIRRHPAGRFLTAGNHLHILEDYHGELHKLLPDGQPLNDEVRQKIADLKNSHRFDTATLHEVNSGARPELWQPPQPQPPVRRPSVFEVHRLGQDRPDRLEFRAGAPHLNGHRLNDEQMQALLHHVKNGHARVRYGQDVAQAIQKMERSLALLLKADDPEVAQAVNAALGRLDQLVQAGHLEPHHAEALRRHAFKDPMTGHVMGNKFAYTDFLSRPDSKQGIHIVMDGNDFKSVNDKFGHEVGDQAIKAMGQALRQAMDEAVGSEQGKLFRVGGDEFAAHVPTHEHAARFARALRQKLEGLIPIQGTHRLSMGIGFGTTPEHADKALYEAKKQKYDPAGMIGEDSRKWTSKYPAGSAPSMAHSLVPGFEGAIPLDQSQLQVKPPPAPMPRPEDPAPVLPPPAGSSAPATAPPPKAP